MEGEDYIAFTVDVSWPSDDEPITPTWSSDGEPITPIDEPQFEILSDELLEPASFSEAEVVPDDAVVRATAGRAAVLAQMLVMEGQINQLCTSPAVAQVCMTVVNLTV